MNGRSYPMRALAVGVAALLAMPCGNALAASNTVPHSSSANGMDMPSYRDRGFVEHVARDGALEVELGRLAETHAQSRQVRSFAERMERDHNRANEQLRHIAGAQGVTMPAMPDRSADRTLRRFERLSGPRFDAEYMNAMVKAHKEDIAAFEREAHRTRDRDLRQFVDSTLPTLREHLRLAESAKSAASDEALGISAEKHAAKHSIAHPMGKGA